MTNVFNNPGNGEGSSSVLNTVIGVIVLVVAVVLFIVYAWPAIQNSKSNSAAPNEPGNTQINVTVPRPSEPAPAANGTTKP